MKTFYEILKTALIGKKIKYTDPDNGNIWQGIVDGIGGNDNSHIDIYFQHNEYHIYPGEGYYKDLFNIHMCKEIQIL